MDAPSERGGLWGHADHGGLWGDAEYGTSWSTQRENSYRAVLTTAAGRRLDLSAIISTSINYVHTGISTFDLTIPHIPGIDVFRFSDIQIYYADTLFFNGRVDVLPGPSTSETKTVSGRGIGWRLAKGRVTFTASSTEYWVAIRDFWDEHTSFSAIVFEPDTPTTLESYEATGTPMEILKDLHEKAGMHFTIQHTSPNASVESYVPSEQTRPAIWTSVDHDADVDTEGYANRVIVEGAVKDDGSNERASGEAEDQSEIDRVGERSTWPVDDSTIETDADAQAVAEQVLEERIAEDSFSGTIDIIPEITLPGYQRPIPEFEAADADSPPELVIDTVTFSEGLGDATGTLEISVEDELIDTIAALRNRDPYIERQLGE